MLANLDKDCTTKQLITSLRNLYPILDEYYSFAFNDDDDFEVMLTITNNMTSLTINNTTIFDDDDTTKPLDDTIIVDKTVATLLTSNRNDQTINNDNLSPDGNNNNTKESPVKAGSVINNVSANKILLFTLEARDFESSEDDSEDDACLPTDDFQDFEECNIHQMFLPPVLRITNDIKESWSEVASLKKGLRGTATSYPTSNETVVQSPHRNNFDALRDDKSSTTAPQQTNIRLPTKYDSFHLHTTRPLSITNVSNNIRSTVTKLVSLPHPPPPSHDPDQEFLLSQELHTVNTPIVSNKTTNAIEILEDTGKTRNKTIKDHISLTQLNEEISFVSSNNSDETYNDNDLSYDSSIVTMP